MHCSVWLEEVHYEKWWSGSHWLSSADGQLGRRSQACWLERSVCVVCRQFLWVSLNEPLCLLSITSTAAAQTGCFCITLLTATGNKNDVKGSAKNKDDKNSPQQKQLKSVMQEKDPWGVISLMSRWSQWSSEYNYGSKQWCIREEIKQNTTLLIGGSERAKCFSPIPTSQDMDITALLLSMSRKEFKREGEREGGWGRGEKIDEKLNMLGHGYT